MQDNNNKELQAGKPIKAFRLLVLTGLAKSNSDAKRLIRQGAVRIYAANERQCKLTISQ